MLTPERFEALRAELQAGRYRPSAMQIADAIIARAATRVLTNWNPTSSDDGPRVQRRVRKITGVY
jgi:hypothetical protein